MLQYTSHEGHLPTIQQIIRTPPRTTSTRLPISLSARAGVFHTGSAPCTLGKAHGLGCGDDCRRHRRRQNTAGLYTALHAPDVQAGRLDALESVAAHGSCW